MTYPIDLSLFEKSAHNASFFSLKESMADPSLVLRDYCIPVNSYFPPQEAIANLKSQFETIIKYYPDHSFDTANILAELLDLPKDQLVLSNGSTELLTWIDHLFIKDSLLTPVPTFGRWTDQPKETGKTLHLIERKEENNFKLRVDEIIEEVNRTKAKAFVLCNPNNPTGAIMTIDEVIRLAHGLRHLDVFVVDESFIDFSAEHIPTISPYVGLFENLIVLKSLGKNFGLHGVRMGYALAHPKLAKTLRTMLPRWNLNSVAEFVIKEIPKHWRHYHTSRIRTIADRNYFVERIAEVKELKLFPSNANFIFIKLPDYISGKQLRNDLAREYGLIIRECGNKIGSSEQFCRIASRPKAEVDIFVDAVKALFKRYSQKNHAVIEKSLEQDNLAMA